ncbi:MAG: hypothetical protein E7327_03520 [Clostridiales bacterium]|nr:hypothetical protein [Clostridiales bacterium]
MFRRMLLVVALLLLAVPALAEETPVLPGQFPLKGLPEDTTFEVRTGPGEAYHHAAKGRAKVSTNGDIQCYGRLGDTGWVLIRYEVSKNQVRVGCIDLRAYPQVWQGCRELSLGAEEYLLAGRAEITDDPYRDGAPVGRVSGRVTLLALRGLDWAYVDGVLDGTEERVRGFIRRSALNGAGVPPQLPASPHAGEFTLDGSCALHLPEDARPDGMAVYPLPDGTYLIAYNCTGSDRLWLRVISETGKKLWAKSVPDGYYGQIALTAEGFVCQTFDNSECDSGMQYTYTCRGRKWTAKKVRWIEEPDRFYCDSTESYTVRYYLFCEGMTYPFTVSCSPSGAVAEHLMQSYHSDRGFLCEMDGELLMLAKDEMSRYVLRIYGEEAEELASIPAPEDMAPPNQVASADHDDSAVYFFTHERSGWYTDPERGWRMWRFDRATQTFQTEPVNIPIPQPCTLTAIGAGSGGEHLMLMQTDFGSWLCVLEPDGQLLLDGAFPGKVVWSAPADSGMILLLQDAEGEFLLQTYTVGGG